MSGLLHHLLAAGFFHSSVVRSALVVGGLVAVVSATVGTFTVLRGQSFAGHALGDLGTTGGAGAYLAAANPLWGFVLAGVAGAAAMEMVGLRRARGRDLASGIVLGAALGLAALFLYLDTTSSSTTGATVTILFGSIFAITPATIPPAIALGALAVAAIALLYRPLLVSSVSPELAAARRIPVRTVSLLYLLALAIAVALAALTVGAILATALLIGPAATALRLARTPGRAIVVAALIGLAITWVSVALAYDSFSWPPAGHGWPVSFFVVTLVLAVYLVGGLAVR